MESIPNIPEPLFSLLLLNTCLVSFCNFSPRPPGSGNKEHVILVIISARYNSFPWETPGYNVASEGPLLLLCFSAEVLAFDCFCNSSVTKRRKKKKKKKRE